MSHHRFVDLKRIHIRGACYFVTLKTKNNFPYLRETILCDLILEELRLCKRLKDFGLHGWVICHDHVHLMIRPGNQWNISKIMHCLKRHASRNINIVMGYKSAPSVGPDSHPGLRAMDGMVKQIKIQFTKKYPNLNPFPRFKWQKSFYDHYCRNETDFKNCLEYIVYNPIKHGLPANWPFVFTNPKFANFIDQY